MSTSPGRVVGTGSSRTRIVSTPPKLSIAAANMVCSVSVMAASSRLQPVERSRLDVRIGELARATGVSAPLLRYYEAQGLLSPTRTKNGYRLYDENAATTVRQVRGLLEVGLSTNEIRLLLPCATSSTPDRKSTRLNSSHANISY